MAAPAAAVMAASDGFNKNGGGEGGRGERDGSPRGRSDSGVWAFPLFFFASALVINNSTTLQSQLIVIGINS